MADYVTWTSLPSSLRGKLLNKDDFFFLGALEGNKEGKIMY